MLRNIEVGRNLPACTHSISAHGHENLIPALSEQLLATRKCALETQRWQLARQNAHNAQLQTTQIDAAIRLLRVQYNHMVAQVVGQNAVHAAAELENGIHAVTCTSGPTLAGPRPHKNVAAVEAAETVQSKKRRRDDTNHRSEKEPHAPANGYGSVVLNQKASSVAIVFYILVAMPLTLPCKTDCI